ncbi:MAG: MBL fold metallo-hydrolase [Balneolaceae bacterium]|nr:MBL fold metallo-hydrolase [Balneolaceae bacterium]
MKSPNLTIEQDLLISPARLADWLQNQKEVYILDVRSKAERRDWLIPESRHLDIYNELKSGHSKTLEHLDLPEDRPIVTVCGAGKTSLSAARQLREKGLDAYSLDSGMKAWNFAWDTAEVTLANDLTIIQVRRVAKGCLSYIIGSGDDAVVIDASLDPKIYKNLARENRWTIRYVMDTHLHADYVSRSRELAEAVGADYLLYRQADTEFPFTPLDDHQEITFGNTAIKALHTPGHTPESLSFLIEGEALFTGDTLFTNGVGRPDLKADRQQAMRKAEQLYESLQKLLSLEENTRVLPAHIARSVRMGEPVIFATIGELSGSLDLLGLPKKQFLQEVVSRIPPTPANYQTISSLNRKGSHDGHDLEQLEAGANRCAVG